MEPECVDYAAELHSLAPGRFVFDASPFLGRGAYGHVFRATDMCQPEGSPNRVVALKRVNERVLQDPANVHRIINEISLLRVLGGGDIVKLLDVVVPDDEGYTSFWFVMEYVDTNLKDSLEKSRAAQTPLPFDSARWILYCILRGTLKLHRAGVIHRDITPSNILVDSNLTVKLGDLGLARVRPPQQDGAARTGCAESTETATHYVTQRCYRAPELTFEERRYSQKVDIWSIGCIFAELLGSPPLCSAGEPVAHLCQILQVAGPPRNGISFGSRAGKRLVKLLVQQRNYGTQLDFNSVFPHAPPLALELLRRMLTLEPNDRFGAEEALHHELFRDLIQGDALPTPSTFPENPRHADLAEAKKALLRTARSCRRTDTVALALPNVSPSPVWMVPAADLDSAEPEIDLGFAVMPFDDPEQDAADEPKRMWLVWGVVACAALGACFGTWRLIRHHRSTK